MKWEGVMRRKGSDEVGGGVDEVKVLVYFEVTRWRIW